MNKRDIVIGVIIVAIIAGIIYWARTPGQTPIEIPEPTTEEKIEEQFKIEIPEDADKAELKDIKGGNASAITTRSFENGTFTHAVLADLPEPGENKFYQGWLVNDWGDFVSTGVLGIAKGGYVLEFSSTQDYTDYNEVVITLEEKKDSTPETHILKGEFEK